jgi:hypothetical protein
MADKIMLLLREKGQRTTLGQEARSTVRERFSLSLMVAEFEECFLKLCGGGHIKLKVGDADEEEIAYPGREKSEVLQ